jgi:hypothetical protein
MTSGRHTTFCHHRQTSYFERLERDHPAKLRAGLERLERDVAAGRGPRTAGRGTVLAWTKSQQSSEGAESAL